jgi:hypothetical protein
MTTRRFCWPLSHAALQKMTLRRRVGPRREVGVRPKLRQAFALGAGYAPLERRAMVGSQSGGTQGRTGGLLGSR